MIGPAPVPEYAVPKPVYEEILVEQQCVRHPPDPFQIIGNTRARVENAMRIPDVTSNPFFFGILEGIWSNYAMFDEKRKMIKILISSCSNLYIGVWINYPFCPYLTC